MELRNRADHPSGGLPHRVLVQGREGVAATVVVTTYREHVWMSIVPPFTWEAIMGPAHIDQLIQVLGLARDELGQHMSVRHEGNGTVRKTQATQRRDVRSPE
jgi:hypothetical protein